MPRSLLLHAHLHDLCRLHWTDQVLDEVFTRLSAQRPDLDPDALAYTRAQMQRALPHALVPMPRRPADVDLPDPDDRHVVAGAIAAEASVIVTANLRHFPKRALAPLGLQAIAPDSFLARALREAPLARVLIGERLAEELRRPIAELPGILERNGLKRTAALYADD